MPSSVPENKPWTLNKLFEMSPKTILDVGAGNGTYVNLIKDIRKSVKIDAIEVWEPYIDLYELRLKYDNVFMKDVREHDDFAYDVVIFGDVLEHMSKEDAIAVWNKASKQAKYAIISIPIIHMPQGHEHGNPYEEHIKDDWTTEEVLESFSHISAYETFRLVGTFIGDFSSVHTAE